MRRQSVITESFTFLHGAVTRFRDGFGVGGFEHREHMRVFHLRRLLEVSGGRTGAESSYGDAGTFRFFGDGFAETAYEFFGRIVALNVILKKFSDAAVTVLGLYYKLQSFFFIPLFGLQTCIVPVLSYNYSAELYDRCKKIMNMTYLISSVFMIAGMVCFIFFPIPMIKIFSSSEEVFAIGKIAFPIIGSGFISAVFGLIMPTFFQAIGKGKESAFLSLLRQVFCLIPIFWAFSLLGLNYTWIAFPISETVSGVVGLIMYLLQIRKWKNTPVHPILRDASPENATAPHPETLPAVTIGNQTVTTPENLTEPTQSDEKLRLLSRQKETY